MTKLEIQFFQHLFPSPHLRGLSVILGLLSFMIVSPQIIAAEYRFDNDIRLSGRFDDNSRLSVGFKDELYGSVLTNRSDFSRATENTDFTVGLDLTNNQYNIDAYSTFDQRLDIGYFRRSERGSWNLRGSVDRGSTRDSELTESGSGIFDLRDTRITNNQLSFAWNNNLNLRNVLVWDGAISTARYDSERRVDYDFGNTSLLWQYIVTERLRFQAIAAYSVLDSDAANGPAISPILNDLLIDGSLSQQDVNELDRDCRDREIVGFFDPMGNPIRCFELRELDNEQATIRLQAGIYFLLNEKWTLDLLIGQSSVDTDSTETYFNLPMIGTMTGARVEEISRSNDSVTYNANLTYQGDTIETTFGLSSANNVNSNGVLVLTTSADIETRWTINRRNDIYSNIAWFDQETSSGSNDVFNDRSLASWYFRYRYRLNADWSISFNYRVDEQKRVQLDREAYSNDFSLTLAWRPTTLKWSR